jgi:U4/U6 small nuclear ribonucleoprotein PRP31
MSTLADELLQDFEDSGSDAGGDDHDDGIFDLANGGQANGDTLMEEYKDDDDDDGEAEAMDGVDDATSDDAEPTDAKTEMPRGAVRDVRSVVNLMKILSPVLEVSSPNLLRFRPPLRSGQNVYIFPLER